jgi:hypothetical protein
MRAHTAGNAQEADAELLCFTVLAGPPAGMRKVAGEPAGDVIDLT